MDQAITIHIVASSSRERAALARHAYDLGRHAELYENSDELAACAPTDGLVLVCDDEHGGRSQRLIDALASKGCWLPVVVVSEAPTLEHAIAAVKAGALDYIALPFSTKTLASKLATIEAEASTIAAGRRRAIEARRRIEELSRREREVLDLLSNGHSNKLIARELGISPRTVEIHRHNMMQKLDCEHSAAAVRMSVEADLEGLDAGRPTASTKLGMPGAATTGSSGEKGPHGLRLS